MRVAAACGQARQSSHFEGVHSDGIRDHIGSGRSRERPGEWLRQPPPPFRRSQLTVVFMGQSRPRAPSAARVRGLPAHDQEHTRGARRQHSSPSHSELFVGHLHKRVAAVQRASGKMTRPAAANRQLCEIGVDGAQQRHQMHHVLRASPVGKRPPPRARRRDAPRTSLAGDPLRVRSRRPCPTKATVRESSHTTSPPAELKPGEAMCLHTAVRPSRQECAHEPSALTLGRASPSGNTDDAAPATQRTRRVCRWNH